VATLRGIPRGGDRLPGLGYYEALAAGGMSKVDEPADDVPPGWVAFGALEAGIVDEVPSYLRWKMRPNLKVRWNGAVFSTNSFGYRTPEIALPKQPGVYRILLFGSSNTMGYGVHDVDVFARHLEHWLNQRIAPSRRVEVVNLAVAGDSPTRRLYRLQQEAQRYDPDWLLFDASVFDGWLEETHIYFALQRGLPVPFAFVREAVQRAGITPADTLASVRAKFGDEPEGLLEPVCQALAAEARRLDVPLTMLILPRADEKANAPRMIRLIQSLARRHGLDHLDLSGAFRDLEVEEFRISAWDKHPSARGHQAIFDALCKAITQRGELPGLPHSRTLLAVRQR
jgi:GDSL-like Lipase/Acylhydrolase family